MDGLEADPALHDAPTGEAALALAPGARWVAVGKRACQPSTARPSINRQIGDAARAHRSGVRPKGGDPMTFGRAEEGIEALEAVGRPWEVLPGVTVASAAAAALERSRARRRASRGVSFLTPPAGEGESANMGWIHAAGGADAVAVCMRGRQLGAITAALVEAGRRASKPAAAVASGSLASEQVWRGTLRPAMVQGAVMLLLGAIAEPRTTVQAPEAALRDAWSHTRGLTGAEPVLRRHAA